MPGPISRLTNSNAWRWASHPIVMARSRNGIDYARTKFNLQVQRLEGGFLRPKTLGLEVKEDIRRHNLSTAFKIGLNILGFSILTGIADAAFGPIFGSQVDLVNDMHWGLSLGVPSFFGGNRILQARRIGRMKILAEVLIDNHKSRVISEALDSARPGTRELIERKLDLDLFPGADAFAEELKQGAVREDDPVRIRTEEDERPGPLDFAKELETPGAEDFAKDLGAEPFEAKEASSASSILLDAERALEEDE